MKGYILVLLILTCLLAVALSKPGGKTKKKGKGNTAVATATKGGSKKGGKTKGKASAPVNTVPKKGKGRKTITPKKPIVSKPRSILSKPIIQNDDGGDVIGETEYVPVQVS